MDLMCKEIADQLAADLKSGKLPKVGIDDIRLRLRAHPDYDEAKSQGWNDAFLERKIIMRIIT